MEFRPLRQVGRERWLINQGTKVRGRKMTNRISRRQILSLGAATIAGGGAALTDGRPGSRCSAGRVESSGPTGVWLPEAHASEGTLFPLRGAADPVQRKLQSLSHADCCSSASPSPVFSRIAPAVAQVQTAGILAAINQRRRGPSWRCQTGPFARRHPHAGFLAHTAAGCSARQRSGLPTTRP